MILENILRMSSDYVALLNKIQHLLTLDYWPL